MKKTIRYLGVESVTYEFSVQDIVDALCKDNGINRYAEGKKVSYEVDEDGAVIVVRTEKEDGKD